ncbi:MAG: glycosyltransferase family 2 protein [Rickettsiales bacterium]|jgi:glycosyltransferase involved in cell wall biosynthesis|nr:glycosyltransferase family 2 protein [Rickettsiales bacterium]
MKNPIVSVIIPNYNYAEYLRDTLDSVRVQTLTDWECIIIDDASDDASVSIIQEFCKQDPRFRLIRLTKQSGVSAARNMGLDAAVGEYIAFLDSDDCYSENALEILVYVAKSTGADIVGGRAMVVETNFKFVPIGNIKISVDDFHVFRNPADLICVPQEFNWCWIWRRIYKRKTIGDARFLPEFKAMGDDLFFMLQVSHRTLLFAESRNIAIFHRKSPFSISANRTGPESFQFFPRLLDSAAQLESKYSGRFWRVFYDAMFMYLMDETIVKNKLRIEARNVLSACCCLFPSRYLSFKKRFFLRFLRIFLRKQNV